MELIHLFIGILAIALVGGSLVYFFRNQIRAALRGQDDQSSIDTGIKSPVVATTQTVAHQVSIEDQLMQAQPGSGIMMGSLLLIIATLHLYDLRENQGYVPEGAYNWYRSGKNRHLLLLDNEQLLAHLASSDGGDTPVLWFLMDKQRSSVTNINFFFSGTKNNPGPGRKFGMSMDQGNVTFSLPGVDGTWQIKDLPTCDYEANVTPGQESFAQGTGSLHGVLAIEANPPNPGTPRWFLYIGPFSKREGDESQVEEVVYIGEAIKPRVAIDRVIQY